MALWLYGSIALLLERGLQDPDSLWANSVKRRELIEAEALCIVQG